VQRTLCRTVSSPRIRLHDLRHTHATLLLHAGVPPKVVSERLGHATVAFTMQVYAHVIPGMQADAASAFGNLVFLDDENGPRSTNDEG
jgi:integrase